MNESKMIAVERQKLIHAGKVLENEQKVGETALKEGDFIVLMTITPKPVIAKQEDSAANSGSGASTATTTTATTNATAAGASTTKAATLSTGTTKDSVPAVAESSLVTGEAYEEAISRLVDMGFDRASVIRAMRSSFNNPERAVEYLTTGTIPAVDEDEDQQQRSQEGERSSASGTNNLDFLKNDPQFKQLRTLIQQNPQMLAPIIEQLGQTSPELLQLIEQNREEFYSLLMEGSSNNTDAGFDEGEGDEEEMVEGEEDEDFEASHPGAQILQVSEEEKSAIERLESMGFDKARVVEAFFACDKNEELAANYLLEHMNDQD